MIHFSVRKGEKTGFFNGVICFLVLRQEGITLTFNFETVFQKKWTTAIFIGGNNDDKTLILLAAEVKFIQAKKLCKTVLKAAKPTLIKQKRNQRRNLR